MGMGELTFGITKKSLDRDGLVPGPLSSLVYNPSMANKPLLYPLYGTHLHAR